MTIREAKATLRAREMTLRHADGEFRVNHRGGEESTAYYTTDLGDAVATGLRMRRDLVVATARASFTIGIASDARSSGLEQGSIHVAAPVGESEGKMDPNANLRTQRELAALILKEYDKRYPDADRIAALAEDLATHVQALDTWIAGGGFLPSAWVRT